MEQRADDYVETAPAATLSRRVACVWTRRTPTDTTRTYRIVPDGCADIIWNDGSLHVAGPDTGPVLTPLAPGTRLVGLRFSPGAAPSVLGVPAWELRDSRVDLEALWGAAARRLAMRLTGCPDSASVAAELQRAVSGRLRDDADPLMAAIVDALSTSVNPSESFSVPALATRLGYSERQLRRRCLTAFGYGPTTLRRILRFQRAVTLARSGRCAGYAELAAVLGYADQAHLARDVRDLAGVPLRRLARGTEDDVAGTSATHKPGEREDLGDP